MARQARFRLPPRWFATRVWRSAALLDELGGPSVKPYQPAGYYRHLNFPDAKYEPDQVAPVAARRICPLAAAIPASDAQGARRPEPRGMHGQRPRSNTPLAALTLLNDPTFVEAHAALPSRSCSGRATTTRGSIRLSPSRVASADATSEQLLDRLTAVKAAILDQVEARADALCVSDQRHPSELAAAELAAWTTVARPSSI